MLFLTELMITDGAKAELGIWFLKILCLPILEINDAFTDMFSSFYLIGTKKQNILNQ